MLAVCSSYGLFVVPLVAILAQPQNKIANSTCSLMIPILQCDYFTLHARFARKFNYFADKGDARQDPSTNHLVRFIPIFTGSDIYYQRDLEICRRHH